jgi:hypothetical protein
MLPAKIEEQLELTFSYLPTWFSRLAFLASVRDAYTGKYLHEGWFMMVPPEEVHDALQRAHKQVFDLVLRMSIVEFCGELRRYLESLTASERHTVSLWLELETYREMIPEGASEVARELFLSQMKLALKTLFRAPDWPRIPAQSAWPRQQLVLPPRPHLEN